MFSRKVIKLVSVGGKSGRRAVLWTTWQQCAHIPRDNVVQQAETRYGVCLGNSTCESSGNVVYNKPQFSFIFKMTGNSSSSSEEDIVIAALMLDPSKPRRKWVNELNEKRRETGEFHSLFEDLITDDKKFFAHFRMSYGKFCDLLDLIKPQITKKNTNFREAITAKERLAVTLRFLGQGDSFRVLAHSFRLGASTVRAIVYETCRVIWEVLSPIVLPVPTKEKWEVISNQIWKKWQFPNGLGVIDGKHVVCEKIAGSGSSHSYKHDFSTVLLVIVDADYKFIFVDVGDYGSDSDRGIFKRSELGKAIRTGSMSLPQPKCLPGSNIVLPYVFTGHEAFPLHNNLMRPYPSIQLESDETKKIYNYRLTRFRRISESTLGFLTKKFRIYQRRLQMSPEHLSNVVLATTCLHNFLLGDEENLWQPDEFDTKVHIQGLVNLPRIGTKPSVSAKAIRDNLKEFFVSSAGSLPWQEHSLIKVHKDVPVCP